MSKSKVPLLIFSFIIIFFLGYTFGAPELPFNDTIKSYYTEISNIQSDRNYETIDDFFYETDVNSLINCSSLAE